MPFGQTIILYIPFFCCSLCLHFGYHMFLSSLSSCRPLFIPFIDMPFYFVFIVLGFYNLLISSYGAHVHVHCRNMKVYSICCTCSFLFISIWCLHVYFQVYWYVFYTKLLSLVAWSDSSVDESCRCFLVCFLKPHHLMLITLELIGSWTLSCINFFCQHTYNFIMYNGVWVIPHVI
jgi:hypothetical protein